MRRQGKFEKKDSGPQKYRGLKKTKNTIPPFKGGGYQGGGEKAETRKAYWRWRGEEESISDYQAFSQKLKLTWWEGRTKKGEM